MNLTSIENLVHQDFKNEFQKFFEEYTNYNSHTNISAIRNKEDVYSKHFVDSLSILLLEEKLGLNASQLKLLDIGTGGGFPAIPLAICKSNIEILALDSIGKKTKFVEQASKVLNLQNIQIIKARAEDLIRNPEYQAKYDIVTSRAVAKLKILINISAPFLKKDGYMVAYKKLDINEELDEIDQISKAKGMELIKACKYAEDRQLIILKKTKSS